MSDSAFRRGRGVERVAERAAVGGGDRRLELGLQQREGLDRRRRGRLLQRGERADLCEDAGRPRQLEPEQIDEGIVDVQPGDGLLRGAEVGRRERAHEPAVDEHEAVEILVTGVAGEVPARVGDRHRRAQRVAAEDHAPALPAGAEHDPAHVLQRQRQPPLLGEAELHLVERLEMGLDRRVGQPAQVVVHRLLHADAPGQRVLEPRRVLHRVTSADRPPTPAARARA
jgi:hypothetical protein